MPIPPLEGDHRRIDATPDGPAAGSGPPVFAERQRPATSCSVRRSSEQGTCQAPAAPPGGLGGGRRVCHGAPATSAPVDHASRASWGRTARLPQPSGARRRPVERLGTGVPGARAAWTPGFDGPAERGHGPWPPPRRRGPRGAARPGLALTRRGHAGESDHLTGPAPATPESSSSYRASAGGLQRLPRRASARDGGGAAVRARTSSAIATWGGETARGRPRWRCRWSHGSQLGDSPRGRLHTAATSIAAVFCWGNRDLNKSEKAATGLAETAGWQNGLAGRQTCWAILGAPSHALHL